MTKELIKTLTKAQLQERMSNWMKVCSVTKMGAILPGALSIEIYDKTEDNEYEFILSEDGTITVLIELYWRKSVMCLDDLDLAISEWSDQVRGHSQHLWLDPDNEDDDQYDKRIGSK